MLLRDIDDIKKYLGRAVNKATTLSFIAPYVTLAQADFILPAIGAAQLAELDAAFNAATPDLSAAQLALLEPLQRSLAFAAYHKYLNFSLGNDGDNGLQEESSDRMKPVRIGVLDKRQRASIENATTALEMALSLLFSSPDSYPAFKQSDNYTSVRALFISSPMDLATILPQTRGNYRLFISLKPFFLKAEREIIRPVVGRAFYAALKAKFLAGTCSDMEKELCESIAYALASAGYLGALFHLNVTQTAGGALRVLSDFDGIYNIKAVDPPVLAAARMSAETEADKYLTDLKNFLGDNAADLPDYVNSEDNQTGMPDNSIYKGIFRMHR